MLAAELGASAIGLVFWPGSPRFVDAARARAIVAALPPFVERRRRVRRSGRATRCTIAREVGLTAVQFHGDEPPATYRGLPASA